VNGVTTVPGVNADADQDSVSSDSGRGPSEEEYRANSLQPQQQIPRCRIQNGELASAATVNHASKKRV